MTPGDLYSAYETGVQRVLAHLGRDHPRYGEALNFQTRLLENIGRARRYTDTETLRHERAQIVEQVNVLAVATSGPLLAITAAEAAPGGPAHTITPQERRNRSAMLQKVDDFWVQGVLDNSLRRAVLIALDMQYRQDALADPRNLHLHRFGAPDHPLPPGTTISHVFDAVGGELLILGAPGAGKTTLLLELTRDLLARAGQDATHPIPVVFPLSSWAGKDREHQPPPLAVWLVNELVEVYEVPRKVAQAWIAHDRVLPLLDGLDEVPLRQRTACVKAINAFRQERAQALLPVVVCSRSADYALLDTRLRLRGAVQVQPLTPPQVADYFAHLATDTTVMRQIYKRLWDDAVAQQDDEAQQILRTPLLLGVITLTYADEPPAMLPDQDRSLRQVFARYVQRMLQPRPGQPRDTRYAPEQTVRWLGWLARSMAEQGESVFFMEQIQSSWMQDHAHRQLYAVSTQVFFWGGGALGGAVGGMIGGWLSFGLAFTPIVMIPSTVACAIIGGQLAQRERIVSVERLGWSWSALQSGWRTKFAHGWRVGVVAGLISSLLLGLLLPVGIAFVTRLVIGLVGGIICGLGGGLADALLGGLEFQEELASRRQPNQGIKRSFSNAWRVGVRFGFMFTILYGFVHGILFGLIPGVMPLPDSAAYGGMGGNVCTLVSGAGNTVTCWFAHGVLYGVGSASIAGTGYAFLRYGGATCIKHYVLRLVFTSKGYMPWNYARFLDYAAERILLRKVGGGYIFVHRLLLEYFAALDPGAAGRGQGDGQRSEERMRG